MLWNKDDRRPAGGRWYCAEKRRTYNKTRSAQRVAWEAAKCDRDPLHRIRCDLGSRHRRALKRMAERDPAEEGSTPSPGTGPKTP